MIIRIDTTGQYFRLFDIHSCSAGNVFIYSQICIYVISIMMEQLVGVVY